MGTTAARRSRPRTTRRSTTASRWCGREAFPLSGDEGINDIRDMIASTGRRRSRPSARAGSTHEDVLDDYSTHVMSFIDPSIIKPFNVVLDAGNGIGGMVAPRLFERLPCRIDRLVLRDRRHLSQPRGEPADRGESPRHRRAGQAQTGGYRHRLGR